MKHTYYQLKERYLIFLFYRSQYLKFIVVIPKTKWPKCWKYGKTFICIYNAIISVTIQKKFNRPFLSGWQPTHKSLPYLDHKCHTIYGPNKTLSKLSDLKKKKLNHKLTQNIQVVNWNTSLINVTSPCFIEKETNQSFHIFCLIFNQPESP